MQRDSLRTLIMYSYSVEELLAALMEILERIFIEEFFVRTVRIGIEDCDNTLIKRKN